RGFATEQGRRIKASTGPVLDKGVALSRRMVGRGKGEALAIEPPPGWCWFGVVGGEAVEEFIEVFGGIPPVEWSGGEVVVVLEGFQSGFDVGEVVEVVGSDDFALHDGEVKLRRIENPHPIGWASVRLDGDSWDAFAVDVGFGGEHVGGLAVDDGHGGLAAS